jgi:hypothetical protein
VPPQAGKVLRGLASIQEEVKNMAMDCTGCEKKENAIHNVAHKIAVIAGTTATGLGVGLTLGVGALAAAAVAEVAIPAVLTFKALGFTCGALGFLKGAKDTGGAQGLLESAKKTGNALGLLKNANDLK